MPTKTPVGEPCSDSGHIPARSSTSQHSSSTSRCCGSTATASRGLIPKNPGSNSPASCSTPPSATTPPAGHPPPPPPPPPSRPPPVPRQLRHRIAPLRQQLPQQLRRHRTPRETAAHRHHRNRLITLFFSCAEALVTLGQVER